MKYVLTHSLIERLAEIFPAAGLIHMRYSNTDRSHISGIWRHLFACHLSSKVDATPGRCCSHFLYPLLMCSSSTVPPITFIVNSQFVEPAKHSFTIQGTTFSSLTSISSGSEHHPSNNSSAYSHGFLCRFPQIQFHLKILLALLRKKETNKYLLIAK